MCTPGVPIGTPTHDEKESTIMRSIGNHPLQIGLVSCAVQMATAIDSHDLKSSMFHQHADGSYAPVKMPRTCEGCGEKVSGTDIAKGFTYNGELVIMTDAELSTIEKNEGAAIEILRFVRAKEIQPLLFSGEKAYYLVPDTDKKRGSKQGVATYKAIMQVLDEEEKVGVVRYTKWGRARIGLLRVEAGVDVDGQPTRVFVIQNMIWPDELRAPELPVGVRGVEPDPRLLPVMRQVVESMTEDWNPEDYRDTSMEALAAAIETKATGGAIVAVDTDTAPAPDDIADLIAKLEASTKVKAPAKKAPTKRAAKKAPARKRVA